MFFSRPPIVALIQSISRTICRIVSNIGSRKGGGPAGCPQAGDVVLAFSGEHVVTGMCAQACASHPTASEDRRGSPFPRPLLQGEGDFGR